MLLLQSAGAQPVAEQDSSERHLTMPFGTAALRELEAQFEQALAAANVPAAALILTNGTGSAAPDATASAAPGTVIRSFGQATADTPFRLGSITKTFTALALLHAAERTDTALSTPLSTLLNPDLWQNDWRPQRPITLGHLIELSAGFGDLSHQEFSSAVPIARNRALNAHKSSHRSFWPPGEFHSYSNLPPAFSAAVIEKLTGQRFAHYLTKNILIPAGMTTAGLNPTKGLPGGYRADGESPIPYWHMVYPAFGALNATPREFARFLHQLSSNHLHPELKKAAAHRGDLALYEPQTTSAARAGLRLGYGAGMYGWESNGYLFFGHGGDADGYRSRYGVVPDLKRGYFLVINTDNPRLLQKLRKILERFLTNLPQSAKQRSSDVTPATKLPNDVKVEVTVRVKEQEQARERATVAKFAGRYVRSTHRFGAERIANCNSPVATLEITNRAISWTRGPRTLELIALGDGLFRLKRERLASVVFVESDNRRTLQGELGNWTHIDDAGSCMAARNE